MSRVIFGLSALVVTTVAATAHSSVELETLREPLINANSTDDHPSVVALNDVMGVPFCTGSLISPVDVLTAAHCLTPPAPALASVSIRHGVAPLESWDIDHAWIDPDYDPDTKAHDIGSVVLSRSAQSPPLRLATAPPSLDQVGKDLWLIGFGRSTPPLDVEPSRPWTVEFPTKRIGTSRLDAITDEWLLLEPHPASACGGDSGGPVLLGSPGDWEVVGVISHGDWLCSLSASAAVVDIERLPLAAEPHSVGCQMPAGTARHGFVTAFAAFWGALCCRRWRRKPLPASRHRNALSI